MKRVQRLLWEFFDNPQSSLSAQAWAWMDIAFIFISVASMFVVRSSYFFPFRWEIFPSKCKSFRYCLFFSVSRKPLDTLICVFFQETTPPVPEMMDISSPRYNPTVTSVLGYCELITVLYFTIDLFLRGG